MIDDSRAIEVQPADIIPLPHETYEATDLIRPIVDADQALAMWRQFQDLKRRLLTADDFQQIADKNFIKRSGWRKIAALFGISVEVIREYREDQERGFTWHVQARATAPNGRSWDGLGSCATGERKFSHLDHDTRATASTRAFNRAIADLVGGGEVSAEEMESPYGDTRTEQQPQRTVRVARSGWSGFWATMASRGLNSDRVAKLLGEPAPAYAQRLHLTPDELVNHELLQP